MSNLHFKNKSEKKIILILFSLPHILYTVFLHVASCHVHITWWQQWTILAGMSNQAPHLRMERSKWILQQQVFHCCIKYKQGKCYLQGCGSGRFLTGYGSDFRKRPDPESYLKNFRSSFFWNFFCRKYALKSIFMNQKVKQQKFLRYLWLICSKIIMKRRKWS
jgi:hypothetical protein